MPEITFVTTAGEEITKEIPVGLSLMRGAVEAGINDILAECGGVASCGTCKIILDEANAGRIPRLMRSKVRCSRTTRKGGASPARSSWMTRWRGSSCGWRRRNTRPRHRQSEAKPSFKTPNHTTRFRKDMNEE